MLDMPQTSAAELQRLGREAAEAVAGADAVEQVEVLPGGDSLDRPAYFFSFLIDRDRARQQVAVIHIRLLQALREELIARGDEHRPMVRILNRTDWPRRADGF